MSIQSARIDAGFLLRETATAEESLNEGLFMGAKVLQDDDPMSLLADAAEELTFSLEESEESRLDERKEKTEIGNRKDFFIDAARKVVQDADEKFDRAVNTLERLFKASNIANLNELMGALSHVLDGQSNHLDPADQFALLTALKDRLGEEHPLSDVLDQALEELTDKESFAIASGLAADTAAPAFSELGGHEKLRSAYRSAVTDFISPRDAMTRVCAHFGEGKLEQGLDFLMTALGNELSSLAPSVDKAHLQALTGDIAAARVLGTVRNHCMAWLEHMETQAIPEGTNPDKLLDAILAARDNPYTGLGDFQHITVLVGASETEHEVLFLQDMLHSLRELPDLFYDGAEGRSRMQHAAQAALDDAVRREEEALGF